MSTFNIEELTKKIESRIQKLYRQGTIPEEKYAQYLLVRKTLHKTVSEAEELQKFLLISAPPSPESMKVVLPVIKRTFPDADNITFNIYQITALISSTYITVEMYVEMLSKQLVELYEEFACIDANIAENLLCVKGFVSEKIAMSC